MALTDSLTHYWKLDESSGNASDEVGGTTLTNRNSTAFVAAKINNGADLEYSSSNYFDASDPSFSEGANMSWQAWIKIESFTSEAFGEFIMTKRVTSTNNRSFRIGIDETGVSKNITVNISSDGTSGNEGSCTSNNSVVDTATWYHVVVTFDGSQSSGSRCKIYVNATDVTSSDNTPNTCYNSTATFYLGAGNVAGGGSPYFDGIIDEVGTWSRTLSSTEVTSLYNGGNGLAYPFTIYQPRMGATTEYPLIN